MTTVLTTNLQLSNQGTGDNSNTWGVVANANNSALDNILGSTFSVSVAGSSDYTLSQTNANNLKHILTGVLTGSINYVFPAAEGRFVIVTNNTTGSFTVTVKQSGGTGIVVPQGKTAFLCLDASSTTSANALNWLATLALGTASSAAGTLTFYNGTNGNTFTLQPGTTGSNLTFTLPTADGTSGQAITTNGSGILSFATPGVPFSDASALVKNSSDTSKLAIFSAASITTATTRTYTLPDKNGTVAMTSDVPALRIQVFTGSGTYTPDAHLLYADMQTWGAGGGGGGCSAGSARVAGGGGGGGYSRAIVSAATVGSSQTVTIGASGTAGANTGGTGGTGGTTSVGSLLQATGGAGGVGSTSATVTSAGGAPGVGSLGTDNLTGNSGSFSISTNTGATAIGGAGGNAPKMAGAGGNNGSAGNADVNGINAVANSGGGGSGAHSGGGAVTGGVGGTGYVLIIELCSQ